MAGVITVQYNGATLAPTPLVQQNYQFIDYGSRWGNVLEIELNGNITGINSSNYSSIQAAFANTFAGQFGTLTVYEGATPIYTWGNIIVESVNCPLNHLFTTNASNPTTIAPYSVKMKVINVPSGVLDPINEYALAQGEDSIVTVSHKVSARGTHWNGVGGLQNAINFCQQFMGANPYVASFIPQGSGVRVSFSENIDRASATYSIQEVFKYNTGISQPFVEQWTVNTSNVFEERWLTAEVNWKIQGSPYPNNLSTIEQGGYIASPYSKLAALGFATGNFIQTSYSVNRDTGAATIQIRASYISGYDPRDLLGFLDYRISLSHDIVIPKEDWSIDADFVCYGPIEHRRARLAAFKATSGQTADAIRVLMSGLIVASPVFSYHTGTRPFCPQSDLDIHENTGLATFHVRLSTTDGGRPAHVFYPKYTIESQPSKWTYDLLPAANIEGHYVLQDLQMMTQGRTTIAVEGQGARNQTMYNTLLGCMSSLSNLYIESGYIVSDTYQTGLLDATLTREWLGTDTMGTGWLYTKVAGSYLNAYMRPPGYKFGY